MRKLITILTIVLFSGTLFGQGYKSTINGNLYIVRASSPTLFLQGSGATINLNSGDLTLTQSLDQLSLAGGNLSLGTNSLLLTGSIGSTGARVTKIWTADAEFTNTPTIGGVLMSSVYATASSVSAITATSLGLGNVTNLSATTLLTNTALTGVPTAPTATVGTNTTQVATTAFVLANGGGGGAGVWGSITGTIGSQTDLSNAFALKATLASPTFTGTVVLPSTTSIGTVSNTEIGYVDGVTSAIQTQFTNLTNSVAAKSNSASPTFTGTVVLPATTSIGTVSNTEIGYMDGVTSAVQTQFTNVTSAIALKSNSASPTFTGTVVLPGTTSVGNVSATEISYVDGATSNLQAQLSNTADGLPKDIGINAQTGTTYTPVLTDAGKLITLSNGSPVTLTLPLNSAVAFTYGTSGAVLNIANIGAGTVTIAAGGTTIISAGSYDLVTGQGATLVKIGINSWWLAGGLN